MKTQKNTGQTLTDIARGIQYTVNAAQNLVEKFYIGLLDRYFDDDRNPITMSLNVSEDASVDITKSGDEVDRASFDISFSGANKNGIRNPNFIEMRMKFKNTDAPEGIQRIIESFSSNVIAKDK